MTLYDADVLAGRAFMGQGISEYPNNPPLTNDFGNIQLFNPYGSGKLLLLDLVQYAGTGVHAAADLRYVLGSIGPEFADHIKNKLMSGPASVAKIHMRTGLPPTDYPFNRPVKEMWVNANFVDRDYDLKGPIVISQGFGISIGNGYAGRAIVSFEWREYDDPAGQQFAPPVEAICSSLNSAANAFDGSDTTFAVDEATLGFYIGKTWDEQKTITSMVIKSPSGRAFSGANPGRTFNYHVETFNDGVWTSVATGTFTEPGVGQTQSVLNISGTWTGFGHRISMANTSPAAHRVAAMLLNA